MTLMIPNGMTFSVGSSNTAGKDSSMGKTLDEMIKDRRTDQVKESKRAPKKSSNSDRSIATGRAKREAATKVRRGIIQDKKPSAVEIEREVYRQNRTTASAKKKTQKKATGGRLAPDSSLRSNKKKPVKASSPAAVFGGRVPPKKAVEAAVKGMEGHQVVMTFIPAAIAEKKTENNAKGKATGGQKNNNNNNNGGQKNNNNNNSNKNKNKGDGRRKKK